MLTIIGILLVTLGVLGGFVMAGGKIGALIQPSEFLTLGSAAIGGIMIATPGHVLSSLMKKLPAIFKPGKGTKDYLDILIMQYELYSKVRKEGILSIEQDANLPEQSTIFKKYPGFLADHVAVDFFADALRQLVNGIEASAIDLAIETDLETHEKETSLVPQVFSRVGDALPGLGIVAAVLGIVVTMAHLDGPPEELGEHIGAALVGTFLGVLLAYGYFNPIAQKLESIAKDEEMYLLCLAAGFRAFAQGLAPMVAIEVARKSLFHVHRPELPALYTAAKKV